MKTFENEEDKPTYVCFDCGNEYKTPKQKEQGGCVSAHISKCGICQEEKMVTHIRDFNWLNQPKNY